MITEISNAFENFASLSKAETSWDNVGWLIENDTSIINNRKILLTIDLTEEVLDECVQHNINYIISYHPVIFSGLKRLNRENKIIFLCIKNDISVFCPHTSLDILMNKYLFKTIINNKNCDEGSVSKGCVSGSNVRSVRDIINILKKECNILTMRYSLGTNHTLDTIFDNLIVGVGACSKNMMDFANGVVVVGEISHHNILHFVSRNCAVIIMEHTNGERMYLNELKSILLNNIKECEIIVSSKDKDPVLFL
ncbi:NGG1-interacting factor 3 [Hamiltosporidium magnivora]|uniref:NGG1-interacting factor 3 n=1 Tax=Hamiltosporidium magnivora TaxID=148818 RepID=A0A4Q9LI50_9MICR|nr:NGG1-interacting factor 3 [Hamiltosporidium magnivora]